MIPSPKISIITACYNAERYIDSTIMSVISQDYPNLEYIIIDGGSTDNTIEIIKNYKDRLSYFQSKPDKGQYHAIQEGFKHASGEIMAWLNADDMYFPWTFRVVSHIFNEFKNVNWITGLPSFFDKNGTLTNIYQYPASYDQSFIRKGFYRSYLGGYLQQESLFWRRELWEKTSGLDLKWEYAADFELWTRFAIYADLVPVKTPLAGFRMLPGEQKSSLYRNNYEEDVINICKRLSAPPFIWNSIAKCGLIYRNLCRLLIWKTSRVIAYSSEENKWILNHSCRTISRSSLSNLLLEYKLSRK